MASDCPLQQEPDSTLPMTTVPISAYLSTIGIMNGPSRLRSSDGSDSMYGIKGSSLKVTKIIIHQLAGVLESKDQYFVMTEYNFVVILVKPGSLVGEDEIC